MYTYMYIHIYIYVYVYLYTHTSIIYNTLNYFLGTLLHFRPQTFSVMEPESLDMFGTIKIQCMNDLRATLELIEYAIKNT